MLNTVFKKLMATYFIILVISFLIVGLLFSQLLGNYYFKRHEQVLLGEGEKINDMVIDYLNGRITNERLNIELQSIERFLNTRIWVLDKRGIVYGVSSSEKEWIGKQITAREMLDTLKGNIIIKKGIYEDKNKTPMLTVGVPIFINGRVENAIIMHSPLYEITNAIEEVHKIIWTAMAVSFFISVFIVYWVSKRLSLPLREMGQAAERLAEGDFSQRVEVYTEDEIGSVTKAFNRMAKQLEKIEENRRNFIAAVAHELRSPLTLIKGFVQGIVDGTVADQDRDRYLNIILGETTRLSKLISHMLDIQRMEADQYPLQPQSFDFNELLRRTLIKYAEEIEKRNIQVDLNFEQEKLQVWADKDAMEQVLINLLDNAMKFMIEKGSLKLETKIQDHKAIIKIQDNGIGIAQEEQSEIWDRFYKVDKSRNRSKEGTGLGLYIVKEIIKRHKQEIHVESKLGEGTAFIFTIALGK